MTTRISVSLLLSSDAHDTPSLDALREALVAIGLEERTEGAAAWTVRVDPQRFESLFGVKLVPVPARGSGPADMGAPPGFVCEEEPQVPLSLRPYVESVGVEPPLTRF